MAQFHSLKVKDVYKETADCSVIVFDVPEDLKEEFKFRQGQHLTLRAIVNNEDIRRSYSLCSGPTEGIWRVAVKQIFEGKFSTFVNSTLKKGDILEVMPPVGEFGVEIELERLRQVPADAVDAVHGPAEGADVPGGDPQRGGSASRQRPP